MFTILFIYLISIAILHAILYSEARGYFPAPTTRNDLIVGFQLSFVPILNTVLILILLVTELVWLFRNVETWNYFTWLTEEPVVKTDDVVIVDTDKVVAKNVRTRKAKKKDDE